MTTSLCAEGLAHARKEMAGRGVGAVLVGPSADFRYLTGYLPPGLERLTMLVVPADGTPRLVVPALEAPLATEHLGDLVVDVLADLRWAGRREREVARELDAAIRAEHDETLFVIVGSGPGSASPHHLPGERVIQPGDPVVVDIGGRLDGYGSDTTRTLVAGEPPAGFLALYQVLQM